MDDKKIKKELEYNQVVNPNFMNFEMLKNQRFTIKLLGILLTISLCINATFVGGLVYIFKNFDITTTTTTTNENATFGGDFNNYNDNSSDNRSITHNNGGENNGRDLQEKDKENDSNTN